MKRKYKKPKKSFGKSSRTTVIAVCVFATAIITAVFGFLSSGYKSIDLTVAPEGAPEISVEDAVAYDGWQLSPGSWDGDTAQATSYSGIRVKYTVDPEIVEKYEEQGYKVEYGVILGVGTDKATNTVHNTTAKLAVKEVDGKLVSATEEATAYLAYSSDEEAEVVDIIRDVENSPFVNLAVFKSFGVNIPVDGDSSLDTKTYVSVAFMRLTSSNGKVQTEYIPAREVLNIAPISLGDFE